MELEIAVERDLFNGVSFSACFHDYFQVVDIVQYFYDCGLQYKVMIEFDMTPLLSFSSYSR